MVVNTLDVRVLAAPTPVAISGGSWLIYELLLTNVSLGPVAVRRVEVVDPATENTVSDVGDDVATRLSQVAGSAGDDTTIAPGTCRVLYLEVALPDGAVPGSIAHRLTLEATADGRARTVTVEGAHTPMRNERPAVLSPPVRGGPWIAVRHPASERGHRRFVYAVDGRARIPGRFAVDWMKLDAHGALANGEPDVVENWYGYGADVLAVADGVVAAVRNEFPESATVSGHPRHPLADAPGNFVTLDLGQGRYAHYEHLKPGSIAVEPGARVMRGEVIGALGFTGHTTGPHLHFHVADSGSPLGAEGLPFVLTGFQVLGGYDDDHHAAIGKGPWRPVDDATDVGRVEELPPPNAVVLVGKGEETSTASTED